MSREHGRKRRGVGPRADRSERAALEELDRLRRPLREESSRLGRRHDDRRGQPPHLCCTRQYNQMRISPLEARAIAVAFRRHRELREKLPQVLERLARVLPTLRGGEERQSFDCPLLEGTRCLVHRHAKPIGCAAWHPQPEREEGPTFTRAGWRSFAERDRLNDRYCGRGWKLRVIPLWLARVLGRELAEHARTAPRPRTVSPTGPTAAQRAD